METGLTPLFVVQNIPLYLDIVLLEKKFPDLFVCIDNKLRRYLVFCIDQTNGKKFLLTHVYRDVLCQMLNGDISIKTAFTTSKKAYIIYTGDTPDDDVIATCSTEYIQTENLPENGAMFRTDSPEIIEYIQSLEKRV